MVLKNGVCVIPEGAKKIKMDAFSGCTGLKTIYVPARKTDYYKRRLSEDLHGLIVEQEPVKKSAASKKT